MKIYNIIIQLRKRSCLLYLTTVLFTACTIIASYLLLNFKLNINEAKLQIQSDLEIQIKTIQRIGLVSTEIVKTANSKNDSEILISKLKVDLEQNIEILELTYRRLVHETELINNMLINKVLKIENNRGFLNDREVNPDNMTLRQILTLSQEGIKLSTETLRVNNFKFARKGRVIGRYRYYLTQINQELTDLQDIKKSINTIILILLGLNLLFSIAFITLPILCKKNRRC